MGEGFIFHRVAGQDLLSKDLKEVRAALCGYPGGASLYEEEQVQLERETVLWFEKWPFSE